MKALRGRLLLAVDARGSTAQCSFAERCSMRGKTAKWIRIFGTRSVHRTAAARRAASVPRLVRARCCSTHAPRPHTKRSGLCQDPAAAWVRGSASIGTDGRSCRRRAGGGPAKPSGQVLHALPYGAGFCEAGPICDPRLCEGAKRYSRFDFALLLDEAAELRAGISSCGVRARWRVHAWPS